LRQSLRGWEKPNSTAELFLLLFFFVPVQEVGLSSPQSRTAQSQLSPVPGGLEGGDGSCAPPRSPISSETLGTAPWKRGCREVKPPQPQAMLSTMSKPALLSLLRTQTTRPPAVTHSLGQHPWNGWRGGGLSPTAGACGVKKSYPVIGQEQGEAGARGSEGEGRASMLACTDTLGGMAGGTGTDSITGSLLGKGGTVQSIPSQPSLWS